MVHIIEKISTFLHYWYFRYLLVTEMYMVEKWERYFVNFFLLTLFFAFFVFNYKTVLPATSYFLSKIEGKISQH